MHVFPWVLLVAPKHRLNLRLGFLGKRTYRDQSLKGITAGNEKSRSLDLVGRGSRGESWSEGK